jgi:poly-gamma-glutamate synthesis protein (capsule biosynthesis protein)
MGGLRPGNHVAEQTTQATNDSVITRFTFTRGTDNHFTITAAEAVPTRIQHTNNSVVVVPTKPGDPSYRRVAQVLESRGAANAGLLITGQ